MRRSPSAVSSSSAPCGSRSAKRPCRLAFSRRTRIGSPRPTARASHAARSGANPASRQAPRPILEMPGEGPEQRRRLRRGIALCRDRGGGKLDVGGCRDQVDADADDQKSEVLSFADLQFEQDAGDLAAVQQQIVRPFAGEPGKIWDEIAERIADRQGRGEPELRRAVGRAGRTPHQREIEIAARRSPFAPAPPAAGGLRQGPHQGALRGTLARQGFGLVVGAAEGVARHQAPARRQLGHRGHRRNSAEAAASAPPTSGPGSRKKNKVTSAVTSSTPLSSPAIGASKAASASSKYMTLTMRR